MTFAISLFSQVAIGLDTAASFTGFTGNEELSHEFAYRRAGIASSINPPTHHHHRRAPAGANYWQLTVVYEQEYYK